MLSNLLQSKKGYREEANQKERQKLRKQGIYLFIYQLFWTQACPEGMCTNGTLVPCEVPSLPNPTTRKGWPHHRGLRPLLFSNSDVGSFTSHKNKSVKVLWDGTYGFSSLSEKTRKSNHLQMSLQRQHFLLSYLKTRSVGLARVWTPRLPTRQTGALPTDSPNWASQVVAVWEVGGLSPTLPTPTTPPPPIHGHQGWLPTANQIRYLKYSNVDQWF